MVRAFRSSILSALLVSVGASKHPVRHGMTFASHDVVRREAAGVAFPAVIDIAGGMARTDADLEVWDLLCNTTVTFSPFLVRTAL